MNAIGIEFVNMAGAEGARWTPNVGVEATALLEYLEISQPEKAVIRDEAVGILGRCKPPQARADPVTGLAVGYVQSGKTMSFTTVAALARDNDYQLIVVITGTSKPLFSQSNDRLERDLRLRLRRDRIWYHLQNPKHRPQVRESLRSIFVDWNDHTLLGHEKRTVLITVMKNVTHLRSLSALLSSLTLENVPAMVIDDEADQAGMNTLVRQQNESSTYRELLRLRSTLPNHTYVQYTATPQAPLLINIIDALSPEFARVLTPGSDYAGGQEYFVQQPDLVRVIPDDEVPTRNHVLNEPPASLLEAMRAFYVGVAIGMMEGGEGNRSMLVHPSQETLRHAQYYAWIQSAKDNWLEILDLDDEEPDRVELVEDFHAAWIDLSRSAPGIPSFEQLLTRLPRAIRNTRIEEVNAATGTTPAVDWRDSYSFILVGGQAMDRGFTVEGLTVTYMPRGVGVGNADTIQQRARFFGYKRRYLGLCRVWLERAVRDAFRQYVEHEEDVRNQLVEHDLSGLPLSEWKRAFFLNARLRPTRTNVLGLDYMRGVFDDDWFAPAAPHDHQPALRANRTVVDAFIARQDFTDDDGDGRRTDMQRHFVTDPIPLSVVYSELLTQVRLTRPVDSQRFTGLLLQVAAYLDDEPDAEARVFLMSKGARRERTLNDRDEIPNLFQGSNSIDNEVVYPGDRGIVDRQRLTVQIHNVDVAIHDGPVFENVPVVAVFVPGVMARDWLVQEREAE
jgi:hypothetical protein